MDEADDDDGANVELVHRNVRDDDDEEESVAIKVSPSVEYVRSADEPSTKRRRKRTSSRSIMYRDAEEAEEQVTVNMLNDASTKRLESTSTFTKRNILAIVSHVSGNGAATLRWPRVRRQIERVEEVRLTEYVLKTSTDCRDKGRKLDASSFTDILMVGGDGIVHEFVSGAYEMRSTNNVWRRLVDHSLAIGIVPCGTDNGIAKGLGVDSIDACVDAILMNRKVKLNILYMTFGSPPVNVMSPNVRIGIVGHEGGDKRHILCLCAGGWGLLADIATDADKFRLDPILRCCRYEYLALKNVCCCSRGRSALVRWVKTPTGSLDDPKSCASYEGSWTNIGFGNCHSSLPGDRKNFNGSKTLLWLNRAPIINFPCFSGLDFVCRALCRMLCCLPWAEKIETHAWEIRCESSCKGGGTVVLNIDGFPIIGAGPVRAEIMPNPLLVYGMRG